MTGWGESAEGPAEARAAVDFVLAKPLTADALRTGVRAEAGRR